VTSSSGNPMPELCFLPGRLRWTLPKERFDDSHSGHESNTHSSDWEADKPSPLQQIVRR